MALRGLMQVDVGRPLLKAMEAEAARQGKSTSRLQKEKLEELGFLAWARSLPSWAENPHRHDDDE